MVPLQNGSNAKLIGVDWGTSSFRAYLMSGHGDVLQEIKSTSGILSVGDGDFAAVLREAIGLLTGDNHDLPIVMCGMIGSKQGWREAVYLNGSATPFALAKSSLFVSGFGQPVWIVPGLVSSGSLSGIPDVMRGEETIMIGAMAGQEKPDGWYCLPGTHSKWICVSDGKIQDFSTHLTGEAFGIVKKHSIVTPLIESQQSKDFSKSSFLAGVELAGKKGGLLNHVFQLRSGYLTGVLEDNSLADMLSGLMIGAELHASKDRCGVLQAPVRLFSAGEISKRYELAMEQLGMEFEGYDAEMACCAGLFEIGSILESNQALVMEETA